ncbi:phosphate ABC transporter membrane protein 1, PhoT family [Litoreibacter ascidiaceicola]|uniref:Phosphate transport system permease protein n=1 Tax=Litoreibacter ascidiaceicola TaxID=1486859 RepID=A0A1M4WBF3_9RHOB|nr:phosphate ABC transporter permease subunit PstC [Litoreibacter ascidiaceicola]SHE78546.1 phosphate ABC transporter membrane protein 1, PhoT family [Litoreibacter ascidiaceicola]
MLTLTFFAILALALAFFVIGRSRAVAVVHGDVRLLHSRPNFHGILALLLSAICGIAVLLLLGTMGAVWIETHLLSAILSAQPDMSPIEAELVLSDARALASGGIASKSDPLRLEIAQQVARLGALHHWGTVIVSLVATLVAGLWALGKISSDWRARNRSETIIRRILMLTAAIAVLTTVGIVLSLIFETINFFNNIDWQVHKFLFGTTWSPLSGVQAGKLDPDKVGAVPLFAGTLMITVIAMLVAVPVGLFSAVYLSDFASPRVRAWAKPMLELLAGIPTVVYGFFAAITLAPFIRNSGEAIGLTIASESALAAGIVMGIMIIPFISSLSDDVINAVPQSLRDGSYGLGATKAETIRQVVLPAALPGIVSAVLLGVSRAVGETMIVVMAAGQGANLTANPLEAVTTVTVQIVMLITGDTEASTAAGPAFTLGFTLFCVTLLMNIAAQRVVRKYRELYD